MPDREKVIRLLAHSAYRRTMPDREARVLSQQGELVPTACVSSAKAPGREEKRYRAVRAVKLRVTRRRTCRSYHSLLPSASPLSTGRATGRCQPYRIASRRSPKQTIAPAIAVGTTGQFNSWPPTTIAAPARAASA